MELALWGLCHICNAELRLRLGDVQHQAAHRFFTIMAHAGSDGRLDMGPERFVIDALPQRDPPGTRLKRLVLESGSASHPHIAAIARTSDDSGRRDLVDAAHFLCVVHGGHPSVLDLASRRVAIPEARIWMLQAGAGFAVERAYLTRLASAVGAAPSTPGNARAVAAASAQVRSLATLAQSERVGVALGAAIALALDWHGLRWVLDLVGRRFGCDPSPCELPSIAESLIVAATASTPALERAFNFGAQQVLLQQRGLWDLLEARSAARRSV